MFFGHNAERRTKRPLATATVALDDWSASFTIWEGAVESLGVNLIVRAAYRWVVPAMLRAVKRFPLLAVIVALFGMAFGAWLIWECGQAAHWPMVALGTLMLTAYSTFLGLIAVKWWMGTWGTFCDYVAFIVE